MSHKHSLAAKYTFNLQSLILAFFKTKFFTIEGTLEAETLVSGKAECLLAIGGDKKGNMFLKFGDRTLALFDSQQDTKR